MSPTPTLRVARPTDDLHRLLPFYRDGLGLEVLAQFEDHAGFDGIVLGHRGAPYHLEFTHRAGETVGRAPTGDLLLVLYIPEREAWEQAIHRMRTIGFAPVAPENPYWARSGCTFEDPDGHRLVLQQGSWDDDQDSSSESSSQTRSLTGMPSDDSSAG